MKEFSRKSLVLLICVSLLLDWNVVLAVPWSDSSASTCCYEKGIFYCGSVAGPESPGCLKEKKYRISPLWCVIPIAGALGLPAVVGGLGAAGFSAGGVGAGGLVDYLQALGANGVPSFAMTPAGQALIAAGCLIVIPEDDE